MNHRTSFAWVAISMLYVSGCGGSKATEQQGPAATEEEIQVSAETIEALGGKFVDVVDPKSGEKIVWLDLSGSQITNEALKHVANLKRPFSGLFLAGTKVTDVGLKRLANLKNLSSLDLGRTGVTDAGLKEIANLKNLSSLGLCDTEVTDEGLKHLANLKNLSSLDLSDTAVTDEGLKHLANLKNLSSLGLSDTQVTEAGLKRLAKLETPLKPALLKALAAALAAAEATQKNNLKQIGIAFHNCNDAYLKFPGAGRSANGKAGLSWRVHLLPYLDEGWLYKQFNLEEPWDSAHNKALIEKMPEIFKTPDVDEAGKTSLHVFTGPGAPFANDQAPNYRAYTDGTSNTIQVVKAGPNTADIWTKPGGLDFDPKNPIKALGTLTEDVFYAVLTDGSVQSVSKTTAAEILRRLIQHQDGEVVGDF